MGNYTTIAYEENYLPTSFRNKDNQITTMTYDADQRYTDYGRLRTITEPTSANSAGLTTTLSYTDSYGPFRVTAVQTGAKTATTFSYDPTTGNILQVGTPTPGTVGTNSYVYTNYTYTALGNVQTITAPSDGNASITTVFEYTSDADYSISGYPEALDQPLRITAYEGDSAGGQVISRAHFRWDSLGRLTAVIDASGVPGNETDYYYNNADQLSYVYYPATNTSGNGRAYLNYTYQYVGGPLQSMDLYA